MSIIMEERQASSAYVARLLRQPVSNDVDSIHSVTDRVSHFLEAAKMAPPVVMEQDASQPSGADGGSTHDVELTVIAGVLEEKEKQGVLLPGESASESFAAQQRREAEALLNLLSALTPSSGAQAAQLANENQMVKELHLNGKQESSDDDVCIMNAEDLSSDTDSDDHCTQRRRISELS